MIGGTIQNSHYGPYVTHGTDSRNLTSEDDFFRITLNEAIELYKQPKVCCRGAPNYPSKNPVRSGQWQRHHRQGG